MLLIEKYTQEATTFLKCCHRLAANMFVTGFGGNLAWKLEPDVIMITPYNDE